MHRDPAKAILVLDAMLEFFDGGRRWTQGELLDESGQNRCLIGALHYVQQQQRIRGAATEFYLRTALLSALNEEKQPQIDELLPDPLIEFALARLSGSPEPSNPDYDLMTYNDDLEGYDHVRALIIEARAIAQAELDKVAHERPLQSRPIRQSRAEGRVSGDPRVSAHCPHSRDNFSGCAALTGRAHALG
jgi:hypothetical protein